MIFTLLRWISSFMKRKTPPSSSKVTPPPVSKVIPSPSTRTTSQVSTVKPREFASNAEDRRFQRQLAERKNREYARRINTELRTYDAHRRSERVVERRDDGPDLLTGIIIGAALAGSSGSSAQARPSEPAFEGGGGTYGGGGAEGSWSDSSSSSDSSVSSSSDSGGGGGGGD